MKSGARTKLLLPAETDVGDDDSDSRYDNNDKASDSQRTW